MKTVRLHRLVATATPEALGIEMLQRDNHAHRLTVERQREAVNAALADGRRLGEAARREWSGEPALAAQRLGVAVEVTAASGDYGSTLLFAAYRTRPPAIVLYQPAIAWLGAQLATHNLDRALGIADPLPVFLAHELYHHLDLRRAEEPAFRRYRPTIVTVGRWRWTARLPALTEIAAGSFAQALLGLDWHPRLLDLISIAAARPAAAPSLRAAVDACAAALG